MIAKNPTGYVLGNVGGIVAARVMDRLRVLDLEEIPYVRNYHLGILSYMGYQLSGSSFLQGLATTFMIMEAASPLPFGLGDVPEQAAKSWVLGAGLVGIAGIIQMWRT